MTLRMFRQQPHRRTRRPPSHSLPRRVLRVFWVTVLALACWVVYSWNQSYVVQELEAPLDHFTSNLIKPLYRYACPTLEDIQQAPKPPNDKLPRTIMISARPKAQVDPVLETWTKGGFQVDVTNTTDRSSLYVNQRCRQKSWKSRLFGIYQTVSQQLLDEDASLDYVVTLEDDVTLLNPKQFRQELYYALYHRLDFYSFHKTSSRKDDNDKQKCIYQWGTQAQVWSRAMLERTLGVDDDTYCRLPIDMYIAQQGPWFATMQDLVRHVGKRYQLPV